MTTDIFDYANFDYVSVGAPNVLVQLPKGTTPPAGFDTSMPSELLRELAKRHPAWRFRVNVNSGYNQNVDNLATVSNVHILQGQEVLGMYAYAYYPRRGVEIRSRGIERALDRKSYKFTSDPVVARKVVEKHFTPLPTSERVGNRMRQAASEWGSHKNTALAREAEVFRLMSYKIKAAIISNAAAFAPLLAGHGVREEELDKLLAAAQMHAVYSDLNKSKGVSAVVVDNGFVFVCPVDKHTDAAVMYTPGDVPADIAQAVAVLGMAPDHTPIPGLGAKVGVDAYVVSRTTTP
jgi:hypothetical protein